MQFEKDNQFSQFLTLLSDFSGIEEQAKPANLMNWNPQTCGDIGLEIAKDGTWWQNGQRFTREKLVKLFSSIMRKENDGNTYLVTPHEKVIVEVKDAHFIAICCDIFDKGQNQKIVFTTNVGDKLELGENCDLVLKTMSHQSEKKPYLDMRYGLSALLSRPVYYELVENSVNFGDRYGVLSNNKFFGLD